jgi:hypothetical protein
MYIRYSALEVPVLRYISSAGNQGLYAQGFRQGLRWQLLTLRSTVWIYILVILQYVHRLALL